MEAAPPDLLRKYSLRARKREKDAREVVITAGADEDWASIDELMTEWRMRARTHHSPRRVESAEDSREGGDIVDPDAGDEQEPDKGNCVAE